MSKQLYKDVEVVFIVLRSLHNDFLSLSNRKSPFPAKACIICKIKNGKWALFAYISFSVYEIIQLDTSQRERECHESVDADYNNYTSRGKKIKCSLKVWLECQA